MTYAAAAECFVNDRWDLMAEVVGNTSSSPKSSAGESGTPSDLHMRTSRTDSVDAGGEVSTVAEAAGEEVSGLIGARSSLHSEFHGVVRRHVRQ